jgi:hypothetical protein
MTTIDFKNLWVNLTVVVPGMVTYGMWRIVVMLMGYKGIDFKTIDGSVVLSLSVLFAIAILQQAVGISIEALLAGFFAYSRINGSTVISYLSGISVLSQRKDTMSLLFGL